MTGRNKVSIVSLLPPRNGRMGNTSTANLRGVKGEHRVFIVGDVYLAEELLRKVANGFRQNQDAVVEINSSTRSYKHTHWIHPNKHFHLQIIEDIPSFLASIPSLEKIGPPFVVAWLVDCHYETKLPEELGQKTDLCMSLPPALWAVVASYCSFDYPGLTSFHETYNAVFGRDNLVSLFCYDSKKMSSAELMIMNQQFQAEFRYYSMDMSLPTEFHNVWQQVEERALYRKKYIKKDIGEFGKHTNSPGIHLLLHSHLSSAASSSSTSSAITSTTAEIQAVIEAVAKARGKQPVWDAKFELSEAALSAEQCEALVRYVDEQACGQACEQVGVLDVKLDVSVEEVCGLIGSEAYERLALSFFVGKKVCASG